MEFFLFGIGKNLFNIFFFSIKKYDKGISFLSVNISVDEVRIDNNTHELINKRTSDIIFKNNSYYEPTSMTISNNSISEVNYEFFTIENLIKDSFEFDGTLNIFGTDINISSKKDIMTFTLKLLLFQLNYMINTLIYYSEHIKSISMNNYLNYLNWTRDSIVKLLDILLNARQYVQNKDYDYIVKSSSILNKKRSFKISFIIQSHIIVLKKMKILYDELCKSLFNFQVITLGQSQKLIYKVTELQLSIEKNLYSNKLFDKYISQEIVEDLFEIIRLFDNIMKKYFILLSSLEVLDQLRSNSFLDKIGCQIYSLFRINQDFSRFTSEIPISIQECHALLYNPK